VRLLPRSEQRLIQKQLFEREPLSRHLNVVLALGKVHDLDGVGRPRKLAPNPQLNRKRLEHIGHPWQRLLHPVSNALGFECFGCGMHRNQFLLLSHVDPRAINTHNLIFRNPEAAFVLRASEQETRSLAQLLRHPRLVEPGGPHSPGVVAHFDREDRETAAPEVARRSDHFDKNGRLFFGLESRHRDDRPVSVAVGKSQQKIADGPDARLRRGLSELGPDPLQNLQGGIERTRSRPMNGSVEQLRPGQLRGAGEGAGYWAASSHHQLG